MRGRTLSSGSARDTQWADAEGEHGRADADGAPEEPSQHQHRHLDRRAAHRDGHAQVGQAGHQAVARARTPAGADVEAAADGDDHERPEHVRGLPSRPVGHGNQRHAQIDHRADQQRVGERAQPGALMQRKPQGQHHQRRDDHHRSQAQPGVLRHALREHRPGIHPQLGLDQQRDSEAEQHAAGHQAGGPLDGPIPGAAHAALVGAGGVVRKRLKATPAQISSTTPKGQVPARKP